MDSRRASLLEEVARLAKRAGEAIEQVRHGGFSVARKDDDSPLTQADTAAQAILGPGLALAAPDYVVLSEEALPDEFQTAADAPAYFVVDPLDGTKDFIAGTGEYSVNVALIEGGRQQASYVLRSPPG